MILAPTIIYTMMATWLMTIASILYLGESDFSIQPEIGIAIATTVGLVIALPIMAGAIYREVRGEEIDLRRARMVDLLERWFASLPNPPEEVVRVIIDTPNRTHPKMRIVGDSPPYILDFPDALRRDVYAILTGPSDCAPAIKLTDKDLDRIGGRHPLNCIHVAPRTLPAHAAIAIQARYGAGRSPR